MMKPSRRYTIFYVNIQNIIIGNISFFIYSSSNKH